LYDKEFPVSIVDDALPEGGSKTNISDVGNSCHLQ
jgi:hypothetical protein